MQRVQWMDPNWETSRGLGFGVYQYDGQTMVGHGGSCPGYRSTLSINPKEKRAAIVMINASGTNPGKYATALHKIWAKGEPKKDSLDLGDYEGLYSSQPWWSESYVQEWGDQLIEISLPSNDPSRWTKLKYIEGDTFRRIRDDETLGKLIYSDAMLPAKSLSIHLIIIIRIESSKPYFPLNTNLNNPA